MALQEVDMPGSLCPLMAKQPRTSTPGAGNMLVTITVSTRLSLSPAPGLWTMPDWPARLWSTCGAASHITWQPLHSL
jgi:hypothetical protein